METTKALSLKKLANICLMACFMLLLISPAMPVNAAPTLSVTPMTWNIIGLDSNNVNVGPNHFPVGARVCNTSLVDTATNVKSAFVFDDGANAFTGHPYINLRAGTLAAYSNDGLTLGPGACTDFYYEVEVKRDSRAYTTKRRYHITANSSEGVSGSTPQPRELYVERLVSQSRNAVTDVQLNGVSVPAGGTMSLVVGNTYTIKLIGFTATQGYNQLESFINFPNTIFQVLAVTSTYTAGVSPISSLYADACGWENNPLNSNYRSCVVSDNKSGGDVTVTYSVKILSLPGPGQTNPQPLSTLLYDFSGSSYHYNSDFGISTRMTQVIDPSASVTISKAFTPATIPPGGTSTLAVTLTNTSEITIRDANFSDTLPILSGSQMVVATPVVSSVSGCGSAPTLSFAPAAGASSFSVSGASIAPNSTCVLNVAVSVPATPTSGTYQNTITNFKVGSSPAAGLSSNTAGLTVDAAAGSSGTGVCGVTLANWDYTGALAAALPSPYAANVRNVPTASMTWGNGLSTEGDTNAAGGNPQPGALTYGWPKTGPVDTAASAYIQFAVDTNQYTQVKLRLDAQRKANGPNNDELYYSTNGTNWTLKSTFTTTTSWASYPSAATYYDFTGQTNPTGITYFRIYGYGANATSKGNDLTVDNVSFTGCGPVAKPVITKTFNTNPVLVNGTSTLSFLVTNSNTVGLTGIAFSDVLPAGLSIVNSGPTAVCGGTLTTTAATGVIAFTGGTLGPNTSCTITTPAVTALTAGPHPNVSGFISSTESGTNSGASGSAKASLVAVLPPQIDKIFNPASILPGGVTTLIFTITNPNPGDALSNVAFSDDLPGTGAGAAGDMVIAATPNLTTSGCGTPTINAPAGAATLDFSGGSIDAGGVCTVKVNVTAPTVGAYPNTSNPVTTTIGTTAGTDTAAYTLTVRSPQPGFIFSKQIAPAVNGPWTNFLVITPGATVYYRFLIENTGDVALDLTKAAVISDPGVNTASCTWPATLPVAAPGSDPIASCTVSITAAAGDHPNIATATAYYGTAPLSSISSASYYGAAAGLNLSKQISAGPSGPWSTSLTAVTPGSDLYYRFTVINTSALELSTIGVIDPGVDVSGCSFFDPLPAGSSTSCVVGPVTAALNGVAPHTNTAYAEGTNSGTLYTSPNSTASYTLAFPALSLAKSNGATQVVAGGTTAYTLTVNNTGSAPTSGEITLVDVLPAGLSVSNGPLTPAGANAADWTCSAATNVITCTSTAEIAANGSSLFSLTVNVDAGASGTLVNQAQVGGGSDPQTGTPTAGSAGACTGTDTPTRGCAVDSDTVAALSADLAVTKTNSATSLLSGAATTYVLTLTNNGPSAANNATLSDPAAPGLTKTSLGVCSAAGGAVCPAAGSGPGELSIDNLEAGTVVVPTLPNGGSINFTITASVTAVSGNVSNTFAAAPPTGTADPTPASATDSDPLNLLPAANVDTSAAVEGGPAVPGNVLSNDVEGDAPATVTAAAQGATTITIGAPFSTAAGGTLTINDDGSYSYTPPTSLPEGSALSEVFDYTITDNNGDTASSTLTITVNRLPQAVPDTNASMESGVAISGDVIANDDEGDAPATVTAAAQGATTITIGAPFSTAAGGSLTLNGDGTYTYTPPTHLPEGSALSEVFDYTITDNNGDTASSTLTITLSRLPEAVPDTNAAVEGGPAISGDVIANDDEGDAPATVITARQGVSDITPGVPFTTGAGGSLTLNGDGTYTYTPPTSLPEGSALSEVFVYTIIDSNGDTTSTTLTITLDRLPQAVPDTNAAVEGGPAVPGTVLSNDDEGDAPATVTAARQGLSDITLGVPFTTGAGGSLTLNGDGTYTYTPPPLGNVPPGGLSEVFSYTITDADGDVSSSTLTITVSDTNDVPNAVNDGPVSVPEDSVSFVLTVLGNDNFGGDGPSNGTISILTPPGHGTAVVDDNGTPNNPADDRILYTPDGNYNGPDSLIYQICDANGDCDSATVTITVSPVNDLPSAVNDGPVNLAGNSSGNVIPVLGNDSFGGDGPAVGAISITVQPVNGTATVNDGGTPNDPTDDVIVYTPNPGYAGPDSLTYEICDANGDCVTAVVSIVVVALPGTVNGVVYHDLNANSARDAGEQSIAGVTVELFDAENNLVGTTTTGADGAYVFNNLPAGNYRVVETDPTGYVSTTTNNAPASVTSGTTVTVNFGDLLLTNNDPSSISGTVFHDLNSNGSLDAGESVIPNVVVTLLDEQGNVVASTLTSAGGAYAFNNLAAGIYTVVETDPAGYTSTTLNTVSVTLGSGSTVTVNFGDLANNEMEIADPAVTKFGNPAQAEVGDLVTYTITVSNNGNLDASNVIVTDTKPPFLDVISVNVMPVGTYPISITGNEIRITLGTVTQEDVFTITILTRVNALGQAPGGANQVALTATANGDLLSNNQSSAGLLITSTPIEIETLPETGFAPGMLTALAPQPIALRYQALGDVWLEIPRLGVEMSIVGVPYTDGQWDVRWLADQAGWLNQTAFPSWEGNSGLTGHAYLPSGLPGPFLNLNRLKWGDRVIVHAYGQEYTYEVRSNRLVNPGDADVLGHKDRAWLTLITCKSYDETARAYRWRVVVQAVLVKVEDE